MSSPGTPNIYFPNLNGVRFVAAMAVVIHHVVQFQQFFDPSFEIRGAASIDLMGPLGVVLFFVLSGFLITYLLLTEQATTGRIAVKEFYIRRVLRIWPLYYLIVLLGLVILPRIDFLAVPVLTDNISRHYALRVFLYVAFLPNVASALSPIPFASQAWSVGVEEQFYLIWPNLLRWVRRPIPALLGVIVAYLAIRAPLEWVAARSSSKVVDAVRAVWSLFNIDCMLSRVTS